MVANTDPRILNYALNKKRLKNYNLLNSSVDLNKKNIYQQTDRDGVVLFYIILYSSSIDLEAP